MSVSVELDQFELTVVYSSNSVKWKEVRHWCDLVQSCLKQLFTMLNTHKKNQGRHQFGFGFFFFLILWSSL